MSTAIAAFAPIRALRAGAIGGLIVIYAAVVGILTLMHSRVVVVDTVSLAQCVLILLALWTGARSVGTGRHSGALMLCADGLLAGALFGAACAGVLGVLQFPQLRTIFVALSMELRPVLSWGLEGNAATLGLVAGSAVLGAMGALWHRLDSTVRRFLGAAAIAIVLTGTLQELLQVILSRFIVTDMIRAHLFDWSGLTPFGAVAIGVVSGLGRILGPSLMNCTILRSAQRRQAYLTHRHTIAFALLILGLALLPALAGSYVGQVLVMVGLYTLMGMGLNIEVGLAGLLDLGFVAFFAVGAYTTALLTAGSPFALSAYTALPMLSFWQAVPIAVGLAVVVGIVFGLPVLGVRGDYLAIATLGLGEIVRVIVLSDMGAPLLAGAQGILQIPKPQIAGAEIGDPVSLFYVTLALSAGAAYVAWRLQHSRLGRAWRALRDDEDVAQALGVNLVKAKLLAYGLGAAFAGLAGAIFATMLTSVYPNSFTLLVSINVLALIVIGGMGTIQGVVVGALILVGLPELLREFGEYRLLFYGLALVAIMIARPGGLWPARAGSAPVSRGTA